MDGLNQGNKKEAYVVAVLGIFPVIWLALLAAPYLAGGLPGLLAGLPRALDRPFAISICADSGKTVLLFLLCYGLGLGIYSSTRRNYRRGEEHGSASWGEARAVNRKYAERNFEANKLLTKNVRIGYDSRRHGRNLLTMVVGGSGAGKTRFYAKPSAPVRAV